MKVGRTAAWLESESAELKGKLKAATMGDSGVNSVDGKVWKKASFAVERMVVKTVAELAGGLVEYLVGKKADW